MTGLRRQLGLLDATMVNVGVMIGSAVFLTASDVARAFPHPFAQLAAWVVAGLFSLAGALTIAELSAALPEAGGLSVYLDRAFGPFWGFFYGWALFVVIQTAAIPAGALAVPSYFSHFPPPFPPRPDGPPPFPDARPPLRPCARRPRELSGLERRLSLRARLARRGALRARRGRHRPCPPRRARRRSRRWDGRPRDPRRTEREHPRRRPRVLRDGERGGVLASGGAS